MPSWRSIWNALGLLLIIVVAAYAGVAIYGLSNGLLELEKVREPLGYAFTSAITLIVNALASMIKAKIDAADKAAP